MSNKKHTLTDLGNYCNISRTSPLKETLSISWKNLVRLNTDPVFGEEILTNNGFRNYLHILWSNPSNWARNIIKSLKIPVDLYYLPSNPATWAIEELKLHKLQETHVISMAKNTNEYVEERMLKYLLTATRNTKKFQKVANNLCRNPSEWSMRTLMLYPDIVNWKSLCNNPSAWSHDLHNKNPSLVNWGAITSSNTKWAAEFMLSHPEMIKNNPTFKKGNSISADLQKLTSFFSDVKLKWPIEYVVESNPNLGKVQFDEAEVKKS
jgi:hypothetical protein